MIHPHSYTFLASINISGKLDYVLSLSGWHMYMMYAYAKPKYNLTAIYIPTP
jgi:hypothetical protein